MSKMSAVLKLLLLATVTLLVSAQGWSNYWSLPDLLRTHVNKALDKANRNFGGPFHVAYHKTLPNPRIRGSDFYVNVLLMVTTCKKDPNKGSAHRDECDTRKPRTPWIDCLVCKQVNGEQLVDCARQINVKNIESSKWHVHVHLMVTTCKKNDNHAHRDECYTQKPKTPWIDCVVCKSKDSDELIDCAKLRDVQKSSFHRDKMSAVLKLLLLATVTLLVSAQEWSNYWSLPDSLRTHINKALDNANRHFGGPHHVAYEKLLSKPRVIDGNVYVNVRLIVTKCEKDPKKKSAHRDECVQQKPKTPWIDCLVCTQGNGEELIDCAKQRDVIQGRDIRKQCSDYHHGAATLLFQKSGNNEQEFGCLGCV
ncbi:hypothetical protein NFI96_028614 [Prochilodus magdalenae]|nr:hypothetical protein NFI96_028614 [Prochilodus magdalenae]